MKNYDEAGVVKHLLALRKATTIDVYRRVITINPDTQIGNKCWGKIDFLEHYCGYVIVRERGKKIVVDSEEKKEKKEKAPLKKMRNNNVEPNNKKSNVKGKVQSHNTKTNNSKAKAKAK